MAPSSTRIRSWSKCSRRVRVLDISVSLCTTGNQYREWIAGEAGADANRDIAQAGVFQHALEFFILKAQPTIPDAIADPRLIVLAKIQNEQSAARPQDANGLRQRPGR